MELWYRQPAARWDQALPLGNGRLGAMVYGGIEQEHIQLNEDSVWGGRPIDRHNPDCLPNLSKIRELILSEQIPEAERLAKYAMTSTPQSQRPYQTLGDLFISYYIEDALNPEQMFSTMTGAQKFDKPEMEFYRRSLSLNDGIQRTCYGRCGRTYTREIFISHPDDVMVIRLETNAPKGLSFDCAFDRKRHLDRSYRIGDTMIAYDGNTGRDAIRFCGMLKAVAEDGTVSAIGEHLIVEGAHKVTLLFTAQTTFRQIHPTDGCREILGRASGKSYEELKNAHILDYQKLYSRVCLKFSGKDLSHLPTDERLRRVKEEHEVDPGLVAMYYQFGRYMLITGSRPGTLPLTLQGIWNDQFLPPWDSKYTININTEMNYWPVETANLSECHEPLFDLLQRMCENGKETARRLYGCRGFVAHHNTDIYADTAPQDEYIPATYWPMGGAWLSTHIYEHYEYTQDLKFLKKNYEILRQSVLFYIDFLVEDGDGHLVTCPSASPENTYITEHGVYGRLTSGPAMDNQILTVLFSQFIAAAELLNQDEDMVQTVKTIKERLPKTQIGQYGQIMEWRKDYAEAEPGHRHVSQLWGVYPGNLITVEETPEFTAAAQKTLEHRLANGGGHTGWSRAWIILLWSRFRDAEKVMDNIQALFTRSTFDNLMDNHPMGDGFVFQIDGNLGAAAGISEMLLQDYHGKVTLLPALPSELSEGSVSGLKLRGGAELAMAWKDGKVTGFQIRANHTWKGEVVCNGLSETVELEDGAVFAKEI